MKAKSKLIIIIGLIVFLGLGIGLLVLGQNKQSKQANSSLVDFPEKYTETCELGSVYSLKTTVLDKNGKEYRLSANVTTKSGEPVGIFGKNFDIADIEGYTVEYIAEISKGVQAKSILTIEVDDNIEPNVKINKPDTAYVGVNYELPKFTLHDMGKQEVSAEVKLFYVSGENRQEVKVEKDADGKYFFLPDKRGTYEYEVVASKANGKSKQAKVAISSKMPGEVYYIEAGTLEQAYSRTGNGKLELKAGNPKDKTYSGAYISYTASGYSDWDSLKLKLSLNSNSYSEYQYIDIPVYFAATGNVTFSIMNNTNYAKSYAANRWHIISVKRADFVKAMMNGQELLPVKFNCDSMNFTNLTEVRLGTITARMAGEYEINVSTVSSIKVGSTFTIPSAKVTKKGASVSSIQPKEAVFIDGLGKETSISGRTFTPTTVGKFVLTYKYNGAEDVVKEIAATYTLAENEVYNPIAATTVNTASRTGKGSFEVKAGDATDTTYKGAYVSYTAPGYSDWDSAYLYLGLNSKSFAAYDYIDIYVYFAASRNCGFSIMNNAKYTNSYTPNEWHKITVERADFISMMTSEKPDIFPVKFNSTGNFTELTEVRIGAITARVAGKIVVEGETQTAVGTTYNVPVGKVLMGKTTIATVEAVEKKFIDGFGKETIINGNTFTPTSVGKIVLTYRYDGVGEVTKEIPVTYTLAENEVYNPIAATTTNTASRTGKGVIELKAGDASDSTYRGAYVSHTAPEHSDWESTYLKLGLNAESYAAYDYFDIYVYFAATQNCTFSILNNSKYTSEYAPNQWHKIRVDWEDFISTMTTNKPELIPVKFNSTGNFTGLTEVRIGTITAVAATESKIVVETETQIATGTSYDFPEAKVVKGKKTIATIGAAEKKFVDGFGKETIINTNTFTPTSAGKIVLTYKYNGVKDVTKEIAVTYTLSANEVYNPLAATATNTTSRTGNGVFELKAGDATKPTYQGAYVSYTAPGYSDWDSGYLHLGLNSESFAAYDYIDIYVYFAATKNCTFSILNNSEYEKICTPNQWHKITVDRGDFISTMTSNKPELIPVKFNSTGNFTGLTEVRIGSITAREASNTDSAVVFDPTSTNSSYNANNAAFSIESGDLEDSTYNGSYLKINTATPGAQAWIDMWVNKLQKNGYGDYDVIRIPIYFKANEGTTCKVRIPDKDTVHEYTANQWVVIEVKQSDFNNCMLDNGAIKVFSIKFNSTVENASNGNYYYNISEIRLGTITAHKASEVAMFATKRTNENGDSNDAATAQETSENAVSTMSLGDNDVEEPTLIEKLVLRPIKTFTNKVTRWWKDITK